MSIDEAWEVWQQRNPRVDIAQAKVQVLKHLESIAARRPLAALAPDRRAAVAEARRWVREDMTQDPEREPPPEVENPAMDFDR